MQCGSALRLTRQRASVGFPANVVSRSESVGAEIPEELAVQAGAATARLTHARTPRAVEVMLDFIVNLDVKAVKLYIERFEGILIFVRWRVGNLSHT